MAASPSSVITLGYGTGSFDGDIGLVVTLGFGVSIAVPLPYTMSGQWANVLTLNSKQPMMQCESNQPRVNAVSRQGVVTQ